ncbi:polysaccharide biosynthesis/export protein [Pseudoroseomonas rhizosphaerae]|uniref:Polysaccharide biosynthesis/export protein n=1 Tax=Teichococcus rhizosphaerae TaxID=1335062 RepID=A0A2C7AD80_9PROT|nr:SLBB domain-containing protein [Pseudoroseomonas rhizosphaerae]PHK95056.1 polysaccharide biosynthesis/export protein [Pseudoroseomonas rhizosphaerae]
MSPSGVPFRLFRWPASLSLVRLPLALLAGLLPPAAASAQPGPPGGQVPSPLLSPPSLPSTLPGGMPLPSLPPALQQDILQRILDASGGRAPGPAQAAPPPGPALAPAAPPALPPAAHPPAPAFSAEPLSNAEAFFAARLEQPLRQFGYDTFRELAAVPPAQAALGTLPDDYVLGRDDEVLVSIRGRTRQNHALRINRDGTLLLPDLPPFTAAGLSLGALRAEIGQRVARELGGSEAFVSAGQLRQIGIFVAGEVVRPGLYGLPAMASALEALALAGGVRKTGTLRAIRVEGPRGSRVIDLYAVLGSEPGTPDLALREGERLVVPPLGAAVAVAGEVTRPGIYELPAGAATAPLEALLRLAGQPLRPAGNRFLLQGTDAQGRRVYSEVGASARLRRGDALLVQPGTDVSAGQVRLSGHVTAPLLRAAGSGGLRGLLGDPRLVKPDPYVRMGLVWRVDAETRVRRFIPFDLGRVLRRQADMRLQEADEVILLSQSEVAWLASPPVQRALRGEAAAAALSATPPSAPVSDCAALQALATAARSSPARFAHARGAGFPDFGAPPCPPVFLDHPALLPFLLDQSVLIAGEARLPGLYPILDDTGLDQVLAAAGGATDTVDLSAVELSREPLEQAGAIPLSRTLLDLRSGNFAAVRLSPRDAIRLPRGFGDRDSGPVTLAGEFVRPGIYDIRRGERLSELMTRAGGLSPQAYPYGAVFTRESVRQRQQDGFARTARELEQSLIQVAAGQAMAGAKAGGMDLGGAITAGRELAGALREARAAGRMVVEANPVILAARPELDVLLEPGDLVMVPKRPNEVTVVGAVLNPGSLQFSTGWKAAEYVRASGGAQRFADGGRAFVVLPNGQSVPAGLGAWQAGGPPIPPGSLVVVPQDPSPYETWGFVRDLTQTLGQISISAAALAVIAKQAR